MTAPHRDPRSVCFITFGCQMNKLDSELAAAEFVRRGLDIVPEPDTAATIIINTCSVREHAEQRALSNLGRLRRAKERDPALVIAIMGCMAQKDGEKLLAAYPHLDIVCGTAQFLRLPDLVDRVRDEHTRIVATDDADIELHRLPTARIDRHRAFVSILRGCNSFCSYCVVPYVRGREQSRPPDHIETEIRTLLDDGCVEITLLGQNVDAYHSGNTDLADLLRRLTANIPTLRRLRFVTSHPKDISEKLLHAIADLPPVCPHLHMPAQSGSTPILAAMNRGYTADRYRQIVAAARRIVPDIEIASDFIVGFPGETDADFDATVQLIRDCQFNQSFIFKYSPREGTRAAKMPDDVPQRVKEQRNQILLAVQQEVSRTRQQSKIGRTFDVMIDGPSKRDPSRLTGRTRGNDIVVFTPSAPPQCGPGSPAGGIAPGTILPVRITSSTPLTLFGDV